MPTIPLLKTLTALTGIISASAAQEILGKPYWTPTQIMGTWQDTCGGRAATFFCAAV
jgi:NCS1 family nucleobase:cation symporter-1